MPIGSVFAAAGYAHIVVDPRGQGWGHPTLTENCPDAHDGTGAPGFMTQSLSDPHGHYYRRLFTDAFRCLQAAREMELVDPHQNRRSRSFPGRWSGHCGVRAGGDARYQAGWGLRRRAVPVPYQAQLRYCHGWPIPGSRSLPGCPPVTVRPCFPDSRVFRQPAFRPVGPELLPGFQSR